MKSTCSFNLLPIRNSLLHTTIASSSRFRPSGGSTQITAGKTLRPDQNTGNRKNLTYSNRNRKIVGS
jgi:hypothetical protein